MRFKLEYHNNHDRKMLYPTNFLRKVLLGKVSIGCAHIVKIDGAGIAGNIHTPLGVFVRKDYEKN